jgi:DNA recombination protein RmuC
MLLAELLSQVLPASSYTLQHRFKSGETVDALIHLGQGGIAIDSKFPLENFRKMGDSSLAEEEKKGFQRKFVQDVRRHIDAISGKYIVPDEGTIDFAFMYIPAENVYYEIIIKEEGTGAGTALSDYSMAKRVIPVSPNSFYAYLQSVLLGLRGFHLEKSSRKMLDYLSRLRVDYARFRDDFEILGRHLNHARIKYEESERRSERFHDRLNELEIPLQPASETDPVVKGLDQAESL